MPVKALVEEFIVFKFYTCIPSVLIWKVNNKKVLSSDTNSSKAQVARSNRAGQAKYEDYSILVRLVGCVLLIC